ncbi:hypothetical protein IWQ57_006336 [Coemansia nantahalensis]|uniref:Uncharacterized protein n=1 Tax=Coemansia nantahalensis TaxID=2789366 RepID=A0ACC1JKI1_9FUNG|nr:hypothetical protein IWQ57_006336 [Coemansia nantahalensis]
MRLSDLYWAITMVQRMEYEARRGILQQPPPGFYNPSSPNYEDNPFAHYDPRRPGPLVWTAIVDNRDESRLFISVILEGVGAQALLLPRPLDPMLLPFAGTRVRVHIVAADPARGLLFAKLAPLEFQPAETEPFWSTMYARNVVPENISATQIPPGDMRATQRG